MRRLVAAAAAALLLFGLGSQAVAEPDPENVLVMELAHGTVQIEMLPELAPQHVERIAPSPGTASTTGLSSTGLSTASWLRLGILQVPGWEVLIFPTCRRSSRDATFSAA